MPTFGLRKIPELPSDGPCRIVSLVRGERDDFAKYAEEVRQRGGRSELNELLSLMSRIAEGQPVPPDKFKPLQGAKQKRFGEHEFKYKRLRIYACGTVDGTLLVCCSYQPVKTSRGTGKANNQRDTIQQFRTLIDQLPDDLTALPYV